MRAPTSSVPEYAKAAETIAGAVLAYVEGPALARMRAAVEKMKAAVARLGGGSR